MLGYEALEKEVLLPVMLISIDPRDGSQVKSQSGMESRERIALIRGYVTVHVLTFLLQIQVDPWIRSAASAKFMVVFPSSKDILIFSI